MHVNQSCLSVLCVTVADCVSEFVCLIFCWICLGNQLFQGTPWGQVVLEVIVVIPLYHDWLMFYALNIASSNFVPCAEFYQIRHGWKGNCTSEACNQQACDWAREMENKNFKCQICLSLSTYFPTTKKRKCCKYPTYKGELLAT